MRLVWLSTSFLTTVSLAGCLKSTAFTCSDDSSCGANGFCEAPQSVCSITDTGCDSGRRFDSSAGSLAGQCVGGTSPTDGGVDTPTDSDGDGPIDTPVDTPTGCNPDFLTITGGNAGHKYKLITTVNDWISQENNVCAQQSSYMAIPDDATERQALADLNGGNEIWVGVSDRLVEGVFRDTKNNIYNALPITGNKVPDDCVRTPDGGSLDVVGCDKTKATVCECEE